MSVLPFILAISPFVLFLFFLFWKKTQLVWVSLTTLILVCLLSILYWKIIPDFLIGSLIKGFLVALDIFFIIFGAILFLEILKVTDVIKNIGFYLESISKDIRIQVIFLAWFFENFLEGTAGFGTPSTIVAPLLMGLGISPVKAVIIALLGNSASVAFGAAGTPIKVGFGALAGSSLPWTAALLNLVGILVPVFILWFITRGKIKANKEFFEALPFAIWSGVAFTVPSILALFLGQEFPSIIGAIIGLILVLITTKLKIFIPKIEKEMTDVVTKATLPILKVIMPYIILIILLVVGKFTIGTAGIPVPLIIRHTFSYFNPGFVFIISSVISILIFKVNLTRVYPIIKTSFKRSVEPFLIIAFMSGVAQVMVNSIHNYSLLPSMINYLALHTKNMFLPLWAPIAGAFGSFLTGSATVSNLMFGNFLATSAKELGFRVDSVLALALVGGAAGNMIALADIIAAEAVVGLKNEERKVLKGVIIPCVIYVLAVGLIGILFLR